MRELVCHLGDLLFFIGDFACGELVPFGRFAFFLLGILHAGISVPLGRFAFFIGDFACGN
jgi:hypothetical protein